MPFWTILYLFGYWLLLAGLSLSSLRWGDGITRRSTLSVAATMSLQFLLASPGQWRELATAVFVTDLMLFGYLSWLAIKSPRRWLLFLSAFQLLAVMGHVAKMLTPAISRLTYAILEGGGAYFQLICLSIALLSAIRHRRSQTSRPVTD